MANWGISVKRRDAGLMFKVTSKKYILSKKRERENKEMERERWPHCEL